MGNSVLPTLPGLSWNTVKAPRFNTRVQTSVDLSELRASFSSAPVYEFKRSYDLLRDNVANNELQSLGGFFLARYGSWDSWLFTDTDDYVATAQAFGTGDGATTLFQLKRSFGSFNEPVANVNTITQVTVSNTPTSNYSVDSVGRVTFTSAPAANAPLAWTGTYYFRCRFKEDSQDYTQFMSKLWELKLFEFVGSLGTKI